MYILYTIVFHLLLPELYFELGVLNNICTKKTDYLVFKECIVKLKLKSFDIGPFISRPPNLICIC